MRDGEGFLLVYSLTQRSTFVPLEKVYEQIKRVKDTSRVPVVLIGNKVSNVQCCMLHDFITKTTPLETCEKAYLLIQGVSFQEKFYS